MQSEIETETARKALHALVFDHHIAIQRAHSFFSRPLGHALQKVGAEPESSDFPTHYDRKLCILTAIIHDSSDDTSDSGHFRWKRFHYYQCEGLVPVQMGQRLSDLRRQFGNWMKKPEPDFLGCQVTEAAPQRIGIPGLDRSGNQLSAIFKA